MRERWAAVPFWMRVLAWIGGMLAAIALVLLPDDLARDDDAAALAERGVETAALDVRVHVSNSYDLNEVEVTFVTQQGERVTTSLTGIPGHGVNRPSGWQSPGPSTGYDMPLSIRYDPRNPSLAMEIGDYADYRDYEFWMFTLVLLAAGLAMAGPAAVRFLRG